jgi:hypothetical protein
MIFTHSNSRRLSPPALLLALVGAVVIVRWLFLAATGIAFEDSYISLRYAENLASGHGMVYNPGERVFGASTPLYVLLLGGLVRLGLPALLIAKGLASLADGVTLYLWGRWLLRENRPLLALPFFAILFGLSPFFVQVSVSGMETSFALLLLSLVLLSDIEDRPAALGLFSGLLILVRPDGALAAAVVLALRWWRTRRVPWLPGLLAAAVVLPWIVIAAWYYGSPIPHSIPAKVAAYNLHRPSLLPNLLDTLSQFAPIRGPWGRLLANVIVFPCLLLGLRAAWRTPRLRPVGLLFLAWWTYLVIPKTLLFTWYFPPLLLPAYVLAALGFGSLPSIFPDQIARFRRFPATVMTVLALALTGWTAWAGLRAQRVQKAEQAVRREIGEWLRDHTPRRARVAMEPIGYIGYYSGRRVLDEVGLVSPEMVPLNRQGAGWFTRMLRELGPDYIVERPGYLLRNLTLNSGVRMFAGAGEVREFIGRYAPVAAFASTDVPGHLLHDYRFVIYARRDAESARAWSERWSALSRTEQEALLVRAITGPLEAPRRGTRRALLAPP